MLAIRLLKRSFNAVVLRCLKVQVDRTICRVFADLVDDSDLVTDWTFVVDAYRTVRIVTLLGRQALWLDAVSIDSEPLSGAGA